MWTHFLGLNWTNFPSNCGNFSRKVWKFLPQDQTNPLFRNHTSSIIDLDLIYTCPITQKGIGQGPGKGPGIGPGKGSNATLLGNMASMHIIQ